MEDELENAASASLSSSSPAMKQEDLRAEDCIGKCATVNERERFWFLGEREMESERFVSYLFCWRWKLWAVVFVLLAREKVVTG
ncbi:hypothetical protein QQ045_020576 [Rhodiola kirilowii]